MRVCKTEDIPRACCHKIPFIFAVTVWSCVCVCVCVCCCDNNMLLCVLIHVCAQVEWNGCTLEEGANSSWSLSCVTDLILSFGTLVLYRNSSFQFCYINAVQKLFVSICCLCVGSASIPKLSTCFCFVQGRNVFMLCIQLAWNCGCAKPNELWIVPSCPRSHSFFLPFHPIQTWNSNNHNPGPTPRLSKRRRNAQTRIHKQYQTTCLWR